MKRYILITFLFFSYPEIALAEQNIDVKQINQQLNHVNDWLEYQEFSYKKQQIIEEFIKKTTGLSFDNFETQLKIENQKQNEILMNMVKNLQPKTPELIEIKKLWLGMLQQVTKKIDKEQDTDYDEINTKIDMINSRLEIKVFYFIQQHNPPEYVIDWIRYKQLKNDIEQKCNALDKSFNSLFTQTKKHNLIEFKQKYIEKNTDIKLELLSHFQTNSSELKNIINLQVDAEKAIQKMHLNALLNSVSDADEINVVSGNTDNIKKLENQYEYKIINYVRILYEEIKLHR